MLERERVRFTALDNWDPVMAAGGRSRPAGAAWGNRCWARLRMLTFLIWWLGLMRVPDDHQLGRTTGALRGRGDLGDDVSTRFCSHSSRASRSTWSTWCGRGARITVSLIDLAISLYNVVIVAMVLRAGHFVDVIGDPRQADVLTRADHFD